MAYDPSLRGLGIGDPTDADRRREAREDARAAAASPPANASYGLVLEAEGSSSSNLAYGVARRVYPAISALDPPKPAGLPYQYGQAGGAATLDTPASLERRAPAERAMAPEARAAAQVWIMDTRTGRPTPTKQTAGVSRTSTASSRTSTASSRTLPAPLVALIAQGSAASPIAEQLTRAERTLDPRESEPPAPEPPAPEPPAPEQPATPAGLPAWVLPAGIAAAALVVWRMVKR
jgi:hypothetical protein